jgi:hypothetical protein
MVAGDVRQNDAKLAVGKECTAECERRTGKPWWHVSRETSVSFSDAQKEEMGHQGRTSQPGGLERCLLE